MHPKISMYAKYKTQSGAALVVSLVFLVVMTILALSMSKTTTLEERMAGNAFNLNKGFQGAESAVTSGANNANAFNTLITPSAWSSYLTCGAACSTLWQTNGTKVGPPGRQMPDLADDPYYLYSVRATGVTHGSKETPPSRTVDYYDVIGRSPGTNSDAEAINSSVVARP